MKILILDNYDSFTYNLLHIVKELGRDADVVRNDKIAIEDVAQYDKIILSPGPGVPSDAGVMPAIIERYSATKSILGICLGEQAIGEAFGAKLINLKEVVHGLATPIKIINDDYIFNNLPSTTIEVGRYHSWVVSRENLPETVVITAQDEVGEIMAIKHATYDVHGVQFHPESVLTPYGKTIIENFLNH